MPARTNFVHSKPSRARLVPTLPALSRWIAGPFAAVTRIVCDGKGKCHGEGTQSFNGNIVPFVDQGATYTVNPDCTGSIKVNLVGGLPPIHLDFIIVNQYGKASCRERAELDA